MYHDIIHINFNYHNWRDITFDYSFLISKYSKDKFSSINYGELLQKFEEIEFNIKYLKFNDIDLENDVYCSYNYQSNFNVFFSAYKKIIQNKDFDINFEYGNIVNGIFIPNNMNFFAGVYFAFNKNDNFEFVIGRKKYLKTKEIYQLIDIEGNTIHKEITDIERYFEQHFFENYEVKVALRKYKLSRLKLFEEEN